MIFAPWHRLAGLVFVAASGGTTLIHRAVYDASRNRPPLAIEMGLCLVTMMLASMGVMLLIHGRRLFERMPASSRRSLEDRVLGPIPPAGRVYDTRRGVALMQAHASLKRARASCSSHMHPLQHGDSIERIRLRQKL